MLPVSNSPENMAAAGAFCAGIATAAAATPAIAIATAAHAPAGTVPAAVDSCIVAITNVDPA